MPPHAVEHRATVSGAARPLTVPDGAVSPAARNHSSAGGILNPLARGVATIFMLHRFAETSDRPGHGVALLRQQLQYLRRRRFRLVGLAELLAELGDAHRPLPPTVVFTVDDGYADFAQYGASIFAEFDCPVTVFLATGFLDRELWLWWDRIRYAFEHAPTRSCSLDIAGATVRYEWTSPHDSRRCATDLGARLERVADSELRRVVDSLPELLEVGVPALPTADYAPLTWGDVRRLASTGVTFGAHTVTHPILSQTTAPALDEEISKSWHRVRSETDSCTPVFCYPNGQEYAVGGREHAAVAASGLAGAVTAVPRYANRAHGRHELGRYAIPRFACPEDPRQFRDIVSGLERLKAPIRRALGR